MRPANKSHGYTHLIGIDEAGRGPLAGPVVVAGVCVPYRMRLGVCFFGIKDSKKLSATQREQWFRIITSHPNIQWCATSVSPQVIDRINIAVSANRGSRRVCKKLSKGAIVHVVLDGGLRVHPRISQETIIKGDEQHPLIAAASIIAKVTRDRMMRRLHQKYPQYRFDLHKGYGTHLHRILIRQYGPSPVHRKTFHW